MDPSWARLVGIGRPYREVGGKKDCVIEEKW